MSLPGKKLVLVYPPYSTATAPPLGVCSLKGFVQRTLPDWSVKVLDFNLAAHQELFDRLARQSCFADALLPEGPLGEIALSHAAQVFRGQSPPEFYTRADRYFLYSNLWLRLVPPALVPAALQQACQQGPLPASITQYAQRVRQEQPTAVGISICYQEQLPAGLGLARAIRQQTPAPIILGGTLFNSGVEAAWAAHRQVVDYIVTGEGEQPLVDILTGRAEAQSVPGVICLRHGTVTPTPPAFEQDLDVLGEPDFSDLDLQAYYSPEPVLPVLTSRGCYWRRCAFCVHYKSAGQTYRRRSIPAVVAQLRGHVARGVRHFALIDEMIAPAQFSQLADAITAAGLSIRYYALAKPVQQFDRGLLQRMYQSGCRYVLWGVESGSQRVLDLMDKGTTVKQIEQVLQAAGQVGIRNHVFIMAGFPTETRDEFQATLDLLARHKNVIAMVHRGPFGLEKGSVVFDQPQNFSITRCWPKQASQSYDFQCASGMTRPEVMQAFTQAIPFFRSFASPVPQFGDFRFRDHALLIYSHEPTSR